MKFDTVKYVGIVGSRRRRCEHEVRELVRSLPRNVVVISGGAKGPDNWAIDEAKKLGIKTIVLRPKKRGPGYGWACRAYTERNRKIADSVEILFAFVASDRRGGTEQTIKFAKRNGVKVVLC